MTFEVRAGAGSYVCGEETAMLESLDSAVGVVLDKLTELKLDENTLVIFTSDNGGLATTEGPDTPATSNAPLREGKGWLYEGGLRVPLIVRWPGRGKAGATEATPACSVDIVPTVLDLAGGAHDARFHSRLHLSSLHRAHAHHV